MSASESEAAVDPVKSEAEEEQPSDKMADEKDEKVAEDEEKEEEKEEKKETSTDEKPPEKKGEHLRSTGLNFKVTARGEMPPEFEDTRVVTYRDFSHVKPPEGAMPFPRRNPTNKEATFPMKLHVIISSPEFWEITWLPHGRSWRINNPKSFEERVIPIFFRHGRYTSFARQVNGWGFRRITHGSDFNSYYHELFLRGMPHLCDRMRRLTAKDIGSRKKSEEEKTPDLAAISKEHPLPDDMPMLPISAVAAHRPPPTYGIHAPLSRFPDAGGGVDNYISSLSDAEIAFLARRQMLRQADPFLVGGDPAARAASFHPGIPGAAAGIDRMQGLMGPGMSMLGGARSASLPGAAAGRMPMTGMDVMGGSFGRGPADMAAAMQGDPRASMSPGRKSGDGSGGSSAAGSLAAAAAARRPQGAGRGVGGGSASLDQFIHQASDNELAQLVAMHDAAAARRRQQMPPF